MQSTAGTQVARLGMRSRIATLPARAVAQAGQLRRKASGRAVGGRVVSSPVFARAEDGTLLRTLSSNGEVSVLCVVGTGLVAEAAERHKTSPTATAAVGRTLLGTLLLGAFGKDEAVTQVTFKGNGPIGQICAVATSKGDVKVSVQNPAADPPLRPDGKLNVGAAVGKGILAVVRSHPLMKEPYTGMIPIYSGEVAEDLAHYLQDSEQTNSAIALGVSINRDTSVRAAGGFLVQVLPFASDETLAELEKNIGSLTSVTDMLHQGMGAREITARILGSLGCEEQNMTPMQPKYGPCEVEALKARMKRAVVSLGEAEVEDIVREHGAVKVSCDFCKVNVEFSREDVFPPPGSSAKVAR